MSGNRHAEVWWNPFEVELGHGWHWEFAGFHLLVFRREGEWLLAHRRAREDDAES
jgi:hypothetical protein